MMNELLHLIAGTMQNIYLAHKEAVEIQQDKNLTDEQKLLKLKGTNGVDWKLVNFMILLEPALEVAKKEFPEHKEFFDWFEDRWQYMLDAKVIEGSCRCKGCVPPSPQDSQ